MWNIKIFDGREYIGLGIEGMTLTQVIAELIYFNDIKSIDEICEIIYCGERNAKE